MEELLKTVYEFIINTIDSSTMFGPIFACFLIIIESIIPALPLFVFITILFLNYGTVLGFILSWIFTIIGCLLSYFIVKKITTRFISINNKQLKKLTKVINKISFSQLVLLIAIPFTPAFLVNIAAGLSKMEFKKFFTAIILGKISLVIFWGFIGTSFVESLQNPLILFEIFIMVAIAYIASKILNKKLKLN